MKLPSSIDYARQADAKDRKIHKHIGEDACGNISAFGKSNDGLVLGIEVGTANSYKASN